MAAVEFHLGVDSLEPLSSASAKREREIGTGMQRMSRATAS